MIDGKGNYTYEFDGVSNYDGDSFRLRIWKLWDFGFNNIIRQSQEISARIKGIDTPELRDDRPQWKAAAKLAREKAKEWVDLCGDKFVSLDKPDKYGRALGDFVCESGMEAHSYLSEYLIAERLAVRYEGQSKDAVADQHQANINYLIEKGLL